MLKPETLLHNRYFIKRAIGQGGMGAVYEALDRQTRQTVAVKQTFFSGDERLDKAFRREAHILEQLHHPALPVVVEFFADEESKYLVMQFVQGDDLGMQLRAQGEAFDASTVLAWTDQLLAVLVYLHNQEPPVIHRDIKPQNIKTTNTGDIILLDFGLAKGLAIQDASTSAFKTILAYTPNFASLEQRRGQPTDARSDLYSLGASVYQLLTYVTPIDAMERAAELGVKGYDPLLPIKQINPRIPTAVSDVLMQALKLNPEERPHSAAAMQAAIRDAWESSQDRAEAKTVIEPIRETDTEPRMVQTNPHLGMEDTIRDEPSPSLSEAEIRQHSTAPAFPAAAVTGRQSTTKKQRGSSYKIWSVILGFGFVALIAGSFLFTTTRRSIELTAGAPSSPSESPTTSSGPPTTATRSPTSEARPPAAKARPQADETRPQADETRRADEARARADEPKAAAAEQSKPMLAGRREYLRYYIEAEKPSAGSRIPRPDSLPTGQFKLHFRLSQAGFLYLIQTSVPDGMVSTALTNRPSEDTGITSNKLSANTDFTFPASRWTGIGKLQTQFRYTLILTSSQITDLRFLNDRALLPLTVAEQAALKSYEEKHANKTVGTKREENFTVVTAEGANVDPLIIEIVVKH